MDQPTGDAKNIFDQIVKQTEISTAAREFDNVDHNGDNVPNAAQLAQAAEILSAARELRRIVPNAGQIKQAAEIMAAARELRRILRGVA